MQVDFSKSLLDCALSWKEIGVFLTTVNSYSAKSMLEYHHLIPESDHNQGDESPKTLGNYVVLIVAVAGRIVVEIV